ncbi:HSP20-like chaperone [Mycena capillaripes]|nr:HSP20-like chaperone [Mycena capillaripes]
MSVARFLNEFRPFFRMLEEPLARPSAAFGRSRSLFDDPFFPMNRDMLRGPAVDVSEAGNTYVVEAELPGVKKENLEVRIGDGGRSLTIQGKILRDTEGGENTSESEATGDTQTQISSERSVMGSFVRTVVLPRPVDSNDVAAKLEDGILRLTLNKIEDKASVAVRVE